MRIASSRCARAAPARRSIRFTTRALAAVLATITLWAPVLTYAQDPEPEASSPRYSAPEAQLRYDVAQAVEGELVEEAVGERFSLDEARITEAAPEGAPVDTPAGYEEDPAREPISLPGSAEASAVTPQAISLPSAEGSVEGMGESFSPVLSSGTATFSVPIAVAPGRAGVQPSLALTYSTTGGNGPVGFGWGLGAPFISRQTDRGLPHYIDEPAWHPREDRFIYNGGQELVPVDANEIGAIEAAAAGLPASPDVPSDVVGWQQYRARVEGGFMRFFRAPDSLRWVVQSKDGTRFDFGRLPAGEGPGDALGASARALERDPESSGVYRWLLTRMADAHGSTVYYLYDQVGGQSYLSDIYYVSPSGCAGGGSPDAIRRCTLGFAQYGARVHLVYEPRDDSFASYASGWRIETSQRLKRVEVTAYEDLVGERTLVRRYHLTYATHSFHSLLERVQVEGRPLDSTSTTLIAVGDATVRESAHSDSVIGQLLPPMTFRYTQMPSGSSAIPGFGTIDASVHTARYSPPHSVDEGRSDLFDVNSDGLPDVIVTDPARYRTADSRPAVGVFFNGFRGPDARPCGSAACFSDAVPMPMDPTLSASLNLSNLNVVPMDIDGDGRSDLLHMPRIRTYGFWSPTRASDGATAEVSPARQGWRWTYSQIDLPVDDTDPRIDLGRDGSHIRVLDVNNDHLIDVVRTTGTVMQTWVNLGWLPGGDGRFGSYRWTGSEYTLSTEPFESCLLHAGLPIDFDDPEVRLADMNGDGIQDLVKLRRGRVIYWPGRGEGVWGDGSRSCPRGEGEGRYLEMATPPAELAVDLEGVHLADVNMDGASDIVQVRFREVDVWFNRAGNGWTPRATVRGTPATPGFAPRIRFADVDGSGTTDILWGTAGAYDYIDPAGGRRPRLLVGIDNGLGAETTITYGSSADDYVTDLDAAYRCSASTCDRFTWGAVRGDPDRRLEQLSGERAYRAAGSPVVSTVVRSVRTTDRFDLLGRDAQVSESQFAYHDGYYEGIEQEFRGFGAADAVTIGDWNNPTVYSRTHFLQGRRPTDIADDRLAENPNEALKGREVMTEVFDEAGTFLSTSAATITNRHLLTGLDGREIHYVFVSETNELRYDTTTFTPDGTPLTIDAVRVEELDAAEAVVSLGVQESRTVIVRGTGARIRTTFDSVDVLGHVLVQTAHGSVGVTTASAIDEPVQRHTVPELVSEAGWIWRTASTHLNNGATPNYGLTSNTYDPDTGDLWSTTQTATITGTTPQFDFGGDPAGEGGAADLGTTPTSQTLVSSTVYNAWGNARASCAGLDLAGTMPSTTTPTEGCLRFGYIEYDTAYDQFAEAEHLAVRRNADALTYLTHRGDWDRGLGTLMSAEDPNELATTVTYDGLGRLTSSTPPAVAGCADGHVATHIRYELTTSPASQPLSRVITTTELECDATLGESADTLVSIAYADGLGRVRATLATGDDTNTWVRSGITTLDKKGTVRRSYQTDFYNLSDTAHASVVALPTSTPYTVNRYDAFGRVQGVHAEDGSVTWTSFHALATDVCDPLDNDPLSLHYQTCTTARTDGHGRIIDQVLRNRDLDTMGVVQYRLWTYYRVDGAVLALVRTEGADARSSSWTSGVPTPNVVRSFTYDSLGRRLSSDDPDTDNPLDTDETTNSWRYLFNPVGDLAAVRDSRGCGQNFFYDLGGRLVGEQYVGCAEAQTSKAEQPPADNSIGHLTSMDYDAGPIDLDVVYHYDAHPYWATSASILPTGAADNVLGRATGVSDRGQRAVLAYDDRGNVTWTARQMAFISGELALGTISLVDDRPVQSDTTPVSATDVQYDDAVSHTYVRTATFDHAGRPRSMTLPADPDYDDTDPAPLVGGVLVYNRRGLPKQAAAFIGCTADPGPVETIEDAETACSTGTVQRIIEAIGYLRDGLVGSITYGDDHGATRDRTVSTTQYDVRRRPTRFTTLRESDPGAMAPALGAVSTVVDQQLVWDAANNLVEQLDLRDGADWPAGHLPQTVYITHDSLYRVIGADYDYSQPAGGLAPTDDGTDWRADLATTAPYDPMYQRPAPMISARADDRVVSLTWSWDYLANTTEWTDDAGRFYERSLGAITNGDHDSVDERPSALYLATNIGDGTGLADDGGGWVEVDYGQGGNVVAMTVHSRCDDDVDMGDNCEDPGGTLSNRMGTLRDECLCQVEQHYVYRWDELNRLAEARRYDRAGGSAGTWDLMVRQRYRYDASNQRTIKQTLDQDPPTGVPAERIALYAYPGDFERRGLIRDAGNTEYDADATLGTETQYVITGARTVWTHDTVLGSYDSDHRLTISLTDLIQTTAAVFDTRTGALLETSTYYPNGARETYQAESATAPEPNGFTGKEADEDTGTVYFGERYLIPRLARWATADPLHVHAVGGGEALNSYHYVDGSLLQARDPLGLWSSRSISIAVIGSQPYAQGEGPRLQIAEPVHQIALARTLGSRVSADQLARLQQAQIDIDEDQSASAQPLHAMRSGSVSQERAVAIANDFVRHELREAIRYYRAGDVDQAMAYLGNAIHTLQDATSPAHEPFQEWEGPGAETQMEDEMAGMARIGASLVRIGIGIAHVFEENLYPEGDAASRLEGATLWAYDLFLQGVTGGEDALAADSDRRDPGEVDFFDGEGQLLLPDAYTRQDLRDGTGGALPQAPADASPAAGGENPRPENTAGE